jgi:hypothetical protein
VHAREIVAGEASPARTFTPPCSTCIDHLPCGARSRRWADHSAKGVWEQDTGFFVTHLSSGFGWSRLPFGKRRTGGAPKDRVRLQQWGSLPASRSAAIAALSIADRQRRFGAGAQNR